MHDFLTVGAAAPLQEAAVAGLELPESYYHGLRKVGVAGSSFFRETEHRFIRFHYAKQVEMLNAAGEKLLRVKQVP